MPSDALTIDGLERWSLFGAHWRIIDISTKYAVVDLCTCAGDPVERLRTEVPKVIEYLRTARCDLGLS